MNTRTGKREKRGREVTGAVTYGGSMGTLTNVQSEFGTRIESRFLRGQTGYLLNVNAACCCWNAMKKKG